MTKARDLANVISGSGTLNANVIPALPASKITSGTFDDNRLSASSVTQHVDLTSLSADNLTSGTVPSARLSLSTSDVPDLAASKITSGTFDDARISSSSVTAHVDLTSLDASNLTSGTIPNARYGTPTFSAANLTSIPAIGTTPTTGTWTIGVNGANPSTCGAIDNITGKYMKFGKYVHCQVRFRCATRPSQVGDYRLALWYMDGLPFTSYNFGTTWFAGTGGWAGGGYATRVNNTAVLIPSNSTSMYFQMTNYTYDVLTHYNVANAGLSYRQHDGGELLYAGYYYYFEFTYIANS